MQKKWRRVTHEGTGISCELGRLTWKQKPAVLMAIVDAMKPLAKAEAEGGDGDAQIAALRKALGALDEDVLGPIFEARVRSVEGLEDVSTGRELFDEAPDMHFLLWVLQQMVADASVSDGEGKVSGSPSTSSTEPTAAGGSPAPSTEPEGGPSHSTVTETRPGTASSSQVA